MKNHGDGPDSSRTPARAVGSVSRSARLLLAALVATGLAQPASAAILESSWSYVDNYRVWGGEFLSDNHLSDPNTQGSSGVALNATNYARSSAGPGSDGTLTGKLAVSAYSAYQSHTQSSYSENWGACAAGTCGTTLPIVANLNIDLAQDGTLSLLGGTHLHVSYGLQTETEAFTFNFEIFQEGPTAVIAWLGRENLVTGAMSSTNVPVNLWLDASEDYYHFSYHTAFSSTTYGAFTEELYLGASVYGGGEYQFIDAENSFHAALTSDPGIAFASDSNRRIGAAQPPVPVPEPSSALLVLLGMLGLAGARKARGRG